MHRGCFVPETSVRLLSAQGLEDSRVSFSFVSVTEKQAPFLFVYPGEWQTAAVSHLVSVSDATNPLFPIKNTGG